MGIAAGPNISRDGLVLFYDFSNIKSFRGEPTTNLKSSFLDNETSPSQNYTLTNFSWLTTAVPTGVWKNRALSVLLTSGGVNGAQWYWLNQGNYQGKTITFSWYVKSLSGPVADTICIAEGGYGSGNTLTSYTAHNDWQRVSVTRTILTSNSITLGTAGSAVVLDKTILYTGFQLEEKAYTTYPTTGTRGTTVATGGGLIDITGKLNNAELINVPIASSQFGGLISFDAVDDYITANVNGLPIGSEPRTISVWFRYVQVGGKATTWFSICGYGTESIGRTFDIGIVRSSQKVYLDSYGGGYGVQTSTSVLPNIWYNVIAVYTGTEQKLYLNGILESSLTVSLNTSSSNLLIGDNIWVSPGLFKGDIALFSLYNIALSSTEVMKNYNATRVRFQDNQSIVTTNLVLNLDASNRDSYKGTGTIWNDLSGFGNNGTLTNGPLLKNGNGGSFLFDGINDSISTNLTGTITNLTVECWYRGTSTARSHLWNFGIYTGSNDTNLNFNFNDGYDLWVFWESGGLNRVRYNIDGSFTDNTIKCLVFTHTGSTNKVYLNGTELTITESGGNQAFTNVNGTGSFNLAGTIPFKGNIYNARVYNRALSAVEVLQNFNATKSRFGL